MNCQYRPKEIIKCPECNTEHPYSSASSVELASVSPNHRSSHGTRIVIFNGGFNCSVCLEENVPPPMVSFGCTHCICQVCFERLGGVVGALSMLSADDAAEHGLRATIPGLVASLRGGGGGESLRTARKLRDMLDEAANVYAELAEGRCDAVVEAGGVEFLTQLMENNLAEIFDRQYGLPAAVEDDFRRGASRLGDADLYSFNENAAAILGHVVSKTDNRTLVSSSGAVPLLLELLEDLDSPAKAVNATLAAVHGLCGGRILDSAGRIRYQIDCSDGHVSCSGVEEYRQLA